MYPQSYVLSKNKKNVKILLLKIFNFFNKGKINIHITWTRFHNVVVFCAVLSFPANVVVGILDLIVSLPVPSILTVFSPSFRNCIFQNLTFLKHDKKNMTLSSFCNPRVVKIASKMFKLSKTVKNF